MMQKVEPEIAGLKLTKVGLNKAGPNEGTFITRWAAGVIAIAWIMHVQLSRMRTRLREIRKRHIENYRMRAKVSIILLQKIIALEMVLQKMYCRCKNARTVVI